MRVDWKTGRRKLDIHALPSPASEPRIEALAKLLDRELSLNPEAWHLWLCAPSFFQSAES